MNIRRMIDSCTYSVCSIILLHWIGAGSRLDIDLAMEEILILID